VQFRALGAQLIVLLLQPAVHCSVLPEMLFASGPWPISHDGNRCRFPAARGDRPLLTLSENDNTPRAPGTVCNEALLPIICASCPPQRIKRFRKPLIFYHLLELFDSPPRSMRRKHEPSPRRAHCCLNIVVGTHLPVSLPLRPNGWDSGHRAVRRRQIISEIPPGHRSPCDLGSKAKLAFEA
jgi:hypothetical protein